MNRISNKGRNRLGNDADSLWHWDTGTLCVPSNINVSAHKEIEMHFVETGM